LLLVLYATGLRAGEALRLQCCDVDVRNRLLTIWDTKFFKSRLVPIGADLCTALSRYRTQRTRPPLPDGERSIFFVTRTGEAISLGRLEHAFARLLRQTRVGEGYAGHRPRLHDLRATFAVHRLIAWYREGTDVQARLPLLSTYLGHLNVSATSTYLTMTTELWSKPRSASSGMPCRHRSMLMPEHHLLGPYVRRFLLEHVVAERNLSRNTQRSYRDAIRVLLRFMTDRHRIDPIDLTVEQVTAEVVRDFLMYLKTERTNAAATLNQRLTVIHSLFRFVGRQVPELVEMAAQLQAGSFAPSRPPDGALPGES